MPARAVAQFARDLQRGRGAPGTPGEALGRQTPPSTVSSILRASWAKSRVEASVLPPRAGAARACLRGESVVAHRGPLEERRESERAGGRAQEGRNGRRGLEEAAAAAAAMARVSPFPLWRRRLGRGAEGAPAMRGLRFALLLLPWLGLSRCASEEEHCLQNTIVGIEGEDTALHPNITGSPTYIIWKRDEHIVAMSEKDFQAKNNTQLIISNGTLNLRSLTQNDAGCYKANIEVNGEIMKSYFDLKVLAHLEPPHLSCTVNNSIQISCQVPTNLQNLSPSYQWKGMEKDEIIYHNQSFVQLRENTDPSKKITCLIIAFNVNVRNSIRLNECIQETGRQTGERSRILILLAVISVLLALTGSYIYLIKATSQKGGGKCSEAKYDPVPSPEEGNASHNRPGANLDSPENVEENRDELSPSES